MTAEEEGALFLGVLIAIGAVDGVMALAGGEELADGALGGLSRIRRTDEAAEILHGVILEKHHGHDRPG